MPNFFAFQQGTERRARPDQESPLLGRFRALPGVGAAGRNLASGLGARRRSVGSLFASWRRYGGLDAAAADGGDDAGGGDDSSDDGFGNSARGRHSLASTLKGLFIEPHPTVVKRVVSSFLGRFSVFVVLPAAIVIAWCALPFPQYPLVDTTPLLRYIRVVAFADDPSSPGHGAAHVSLNFFFFLFVYYSIYNVVGLLWVTKCFNLYNLNWWPSSLGLTVTLGLILAGSVLLPLPIYFIDSWKWITVHNTLWIGLTFVTMFVPVAIAMISLLVSERHLSLRHPLSETQRLFTTNWWIGDQDTLSRRPPPDTVADPFSNQRTPRTRFIRRRWIPASFVRFLWFCLALLLTLVCLVLGEAYAEIYLRTLPHSNVETILYVYSWVLTVYILDGLTGWILASDEGERVASYPLAWIFKLYFLVTYQNYVRALYARLRSPSQFAILQILSSTSLIVLIPLSMCGLTHRLLTFATLTTQSLGSYRKFLGRSFFLRGIAENVSMLCFLGQILALHYGPNGSVYPYLSFSDGASSISSIFPKFKLALTASAAVSRTTTTTTAAIDEPVYSFQLTLYAAAVTWACEIAAGWIVRRILKVAFDFDVTAEGVGDVVRWPELVPTAVAVEVHTLQNMLLGIVRLSFK